MVGMTCPSMDGYTGSVDYETSLGGGQNYNPGSAPFYSKLITVLNNGRDQ